MSEKPVERRFADALVKARAGWAAADAAACAARAGCRFEGDTALVPFLGRTHSVTHPDGEVTARGGDGAVHVATAVMLLHYLLTADGTPPAGEWAAYRELPGCLFYAAAFAGRAEAPLARRFGGSAAAAEALAAAAEPLAGERLALADVAFRFQALPRVAVAALVWAGDEEFPGSATVLFDGAAGHYLPPEDLAGLGGLLAQRLIAAAG
jgi:hypothetical protein